MYAQTDDKITIPIGENSVEVWIYQKGDSQRKIYFNMHDDENTSVEATRQMIDQYGGVLIQLKHSGERLVKFKIKNKEYLFDPNRMFTDEGIRATLKTYSSYSKNAHLEIKKFAKVFTDSLLLNSKLIIAMHNNHNRPSFNVKVYAQGGDSAGEAEEVFIHPASGTGEFFYVTEKRFFDYFKSQNISVVLQDNKKVTDDGSLSVYCGMKNIPYINCEAERGHLKEQILMLESMQKEDFHELIKE